EGWDEHAQRDALDRVRDRRRLPTSSCGRRAGRSAPRDRRSRRVRPHSVRRGRAHGSRDVAHPRRRSGGGRASRRDPARDDEVQWLARSTSRPPAWAASSRWPFAASAPSGTAVHQRLLTLWRLATAQAPVAVVTSLRALLEHTIPPKDLARRGRTLRAGDRLSWAETAAWLFDLGYEPVTEVSEPGTFSRRGGIIDIYPASAEQPARVELFGDEIETLRAFDPVTQRSQSALEELVVLPAREFPLEGAPALAEKLLRSGWDRLARAGDDEGGADLGPYATLLDALR